MKDSLEESKETLVQYEKISRGKYVLCALVKTEYYTTLACVLYFPKNGYRKYLYRTPTDIDVLKCVNDNNYKIKYIDFTGNSKKVKEFRGILLEKRHQNEIKKGIHSKMKN